VTFVVQNDGNVAHDFRIYRNGVDVRTAMIDPGASETIQVDLDPGA